jgi:hypothetical protein
MIFLLHLFMKLKLTPLYVLCFIALTFFIHEVHDWAHTLIAWVTTGCWGSRGFDSWTFCQANAPYGKRVLAILAGPLVNFSILWAGWQRMTADEDDLIEHSIGVSMVFATLPFNSLLAAFQGGGDPTTALRFLFPHGNHRFLSMVGLAIVAMVCIPPLVKAFVVLPWWMGKIFFFPVFLVVPAILDQWLVGKMLNRWLIPPGTTQAVAYEWVIGWTLLVMVIWLLTRSRLRTVINDKELPI